MLKKPKNNDSIDKAFSNEKSLEESNFCRSVVIDQVIQNVAFDSMEIFEDRCLLMKVYRFVITGESDGLKEHFENLVDDFDHLLNVLFGYHLFFREMKLTNMIEFDHFMQTYKDEIIEKSEDKLQNLIQIRLKNHSSCNFTHSKKQFTQTSIEN